MTTRAWRFRSGRVLAGGATALALFLSVVANGEPEATPGPMSQEESAEPMVPLRLPGQRNPFAGCLIRSLSLRFDGEMREHRWAPIYVRGETPKLAPVTYERAAEKGKKGGEKIVRACHLEFTDMESGERWMAVPDRMARSGGMFSVLRGGDAIRFYAGSLVSTNGDEILEWHVLTDDQAARRVFHAQIAAPLGTPRRLRARFWLGDADAEGLTAVPGRPLVEAEGIPLWLDLSEPRRFRVLRAEDRDLGFEFDLGATPATGNFPCVATFAVTAATRQGGAEGEAVLRENGPELTPLPVEVAAGNWSHVMGFAPTRFDLPESELAAEGPSELTDEEFLEQMESATEAGGLEAVEWASSAFQCLVLPEGNDVARLGPRSCWVNPDPDLPSILSVGPNRAQAILYAVRGAARRPSAVFLDFTGVGKAPCDTRERAVYLCDYPTVWGDEENASSKLGVRLADAASEFAATLACMLRREGIPLLIRADLDDPDALFLLYHADGIVVGPGEEQAARERVALGRPVLVMPAEYQMSGRAGLVHDGP